MALTLIQPPKQNTATSSGRLSLINNRGQIQQTKPTQPTNGYTTIGGKSYPTASLVNGQPQQPNFFQGVVNNAVKSWQQAPIVGGAVKQVMDIKPNEGLGAGLGRVMQKVPSPNLGTKGKDIFKATETETKIVDFLSNMPSAIVNSWGKSLETLSTPEGKKQLKEGAKNLPNTVTEVKNALTNKEWGKAFQIALDNPAISVALDVSDFIPISWLTKAGIKGVISPFRKTAQTIVKEGVEEAGFKTVKEVFEPIKIPEVPKPEVKSVDTTKGLEGGGGIKSLSKEDLLDALFGEKKVAGIPQLKRIPGEKSLAYLDESGKPVGKIAWHYEGNVPYKGTTENTISIAKIGSDIKGTGAGSKVIEALKELADKTNARLVVDWVEPPSVPYWKKMGFNVTESKGSSGYGGYAIYKKSLSGLEGGVKVEPKTVEVPKEQLPVGEGAEKVSRLGLRVEQTAIDKKLADDLADLPTYEKMNMKEQGKLARELLDTDPDKALRISLGEELPPEGLKAESVFKAMEASITTPEMAQKLATSKLVSEGSELGQRIKALDVNISDSPVKAIKEVIDTRAKQLEKKLGKNADQATKDTVKDIKSKVKTPDKYDWGEFLKEIECK